MKCNGKKVPMTPREERILNQTIFDVLCDGLDIINARKYVIDEMHMKMQAERQKEQFKEWYLKKHGLEHPKL